MDATKDLERPDWALFRSVTTLCQRAGVGRERLGELLIKELVDNALDASGQVRFGLIPEHNGVWVEDDGPGLPGDPAELAQLFSVRRGLRSSKLWRKPKRGALGNGLRLVAGAALATDGRILVRAGGREVALKPRDDGHTASRLTRREAPLGTRIELYLGDAIPLREASLDWARKARLLAVGEEYKGKSSPWWYCADGFYELCQAAQGLSVAELLRRLSGCAGAAGQTLAEAHGGAAPVAGLSREAAEALLRGAQQLARKVRPERLGLIGPRSQLGEVYAREMSALTLRPGQGEVTAELPVALEAWATPLEYGSSLHLFINRSPSTGRLHIFQEDSRVVVQGCGLAIDERIAGASQLGFAAFINVQAPTLPLTSDGKAPELSGLQPAFEALLRGLVKRAVKAQRAARGAAPRLTIREVVLQNLPRAVIKASGDGRFRYSQRQLYYVMRPIVQQVTGEALQYGYFTRLLTRFENDKGPIHGMYRDPRGFLYHPHLREKIPLGTQLVEGYARPAWTFNKILYIEKKGLLETLCSVDWPERNDCAILAAEGQATRADKDLFDLLGASAEPITFYCIHDADAYGTMIYEGLQHATEARLARRIEVVNLGLDPWEALEMGLEVEEAEGERLAPVADYVRDPYWRDWLQSHRVELNAMTPERLLSWIDRKMAQAEGKLVPPPAVTESRLEREARRQLRGLFRERLEAQAKLREGIEAELTRSEAQLEALLEDRRIDLTGRLALLARRHPERLWSEHLAELARELSREVERVRARGEERIPSLEWIREGG